MRKIVCRILTASEVRQVDMAQALGITRQTLKRQYTVYEEETPIDLSDLLILSRCPTTRSFVRLMLLELLAELDADQLRAVDLERLAESPFPEQRERGARVLKTLNVKYGLAPFTVSTAEPTPA